MAPTAPTSKPSAREMRLARIRGDIHAHAPHKVHREGAKVSDDFLSSKKDKRIMKHSGFMSKVRSSANPGKTLKRRRPNKKLVATMDSLADALPELDPEVDGNIEQLRQGKVRHKSLKSRPGALKRKERLVKGEMARFGASMAALAQKTGDAGAGTQQTSPKATLGGKGKDDGGMQVDGQSGSASSSRWAALRNHISSTMEQNPAFT